MKTSFALALALLSIPAYASEPVHHGWPQRSFGVPSTPSVPSFGPAPLVPGVDEIHHVLTVHDGDTLRTREDGAVRFSGIDAPEIGHLAKCDREEALAHAARDYVANRLRDGVILRRRPGDRDVEKYGRALRQVFAVDGGDVGEELIRKGWAVEYYGHGPRPDWCKP